MPRVDTGRRWQQWVARFHSTVRSEEHQASEFEQPALADRAGWQASAELDNARRALRQVDAWLGRLQRAIDELAAVEPSPRAVAQTRQRLAGAKPDSAARRVSPHDPDASSIAKGASNRLVEVGYAQIVDDGIVLGHRADPGNRPDAPRLVPAITRIRSAAAAHRPQWPLTAATAGTRRSRPTRGLGVKPSPYQANAEPARPGGLPNITAASRATDGPAPRVAGRERTTAWSGHGVFDPRPVEITTLAAG